jgi:16S rRNA (guanine1207-N2)-methyltransferase
MSHYFSRHALSAPQNPLHTVRLRLAGVSLEMATGNGVFAKKGLDEGSRLLLKTALPTVQQLPPRARIGDLGCGWGAMGCLLAAKCPTSIVTMSDVNARAAWLAQYNAKQNNLENTHVFCGDGLSAVEDSHFNLIVCNPPIRAGNAVIQTLFDDAYRCLKTQGQLWVVIRTAQGAKSWQKKLEAQFGNCETVIIESGYRILQCVKA